MAADIIIAGEFSNIMDMDNSSLVNSTLNSTNLNESLPEIHWDDPFHMPLSLFIFISFYIIIFILGLFGNFLVCFVVARQRTMQTVTNFFITNLAIADIFLCLFCVPLTPTYSFLQRWIFGKFLCQFVAFLQCWCVYLSTLTLTSIAIDRFFVIIYPFRPRMKVTTCLMILSSIWIIAFGLTFPYGYYMTLKHEADTVLCEEDWPENVRRIFGTVTTILQFFLPFIIILVCYLCIFCKLQKNKKRLAKAKNSKKKNNSEKMLRKKTSTNQMLVLMVSIFGICWLPINVINIVDDYYVDLSKELQYFSFYFFISHLVAMSSVIYNPILYGLLNDNFKKEFKQIVPCLFVKISSHRDLKNPKNLLSSFNQRNNKNGEETLIRNGEKTMQQETTLMQPNNDNAMISIETDMNNIFDGNNQQNNEKENGNHSSKEVQINDNNLMVIKSCDEITSEHSERTSSRTNDTSIS